MNLDQFLDKVGFTSSVTVQKTDGTLLNGHITEISNRQLVVELLDGTSCNVLSPDIADVHITPKEIRDEETIRLSRALIKTGNKLLPNSSVLEFNNYPTALLRQAAQLMEGRCSPLLAAILSEPRKLKDRHLALLLPSVGDSSAALNEAVGQLAAEVNDLLCDEPVLSRWVCSMLWYGIERTDLCLSTLTRHLNPLRDFADDDLFLQLAAANHLINQSDGMTVYWLKRHFLSFPEKALADNELCCSPEWISFLDLSASVMFFDGIAKVLQELCEQEPQRGTVCGYASLHRLFAKSGQPSLALECAAALSPETVFSYRIRSVSDLLLYLRSDTDGYCYFSAVAADTILRNAVEENQNRVYTFSGSDERIGYIFDYTSNRRWGRILGFDLMTYFMPTTAITPTYRKRLIHAFDLSQFSLQRTLMDPVMFDIEQSSRRGASYSAISVH